jgi:hypothetical protein
MPFRIDETHEAVPATFESRASKVTAGANESLAGRSLIHGVFTGLPVD